MISLLALVPAHNKLCANTSSSSTYIIILCAYYFDRQASLRQVKASAQSSLDVQLGQQQCIPELSELEASLGVLTPVARDPTVRTRPWQAQQPHWLRLSTWYRSRNGSTRVVTVGATHRLCDRLPLRCYPPTMLFLESHLSSGSHPGSLYPGTRREQTHTARTQPAHSKPNQSIA